MAPSSVGHSLDQAHLPADVFGFPDLNVDLGVDDMAPLEHQFASGPSSFPCPLLDVT